MTLEREADNTYDTNAVKVLVNVGDGDKYNMGYIPRDLAAILAPVLDKGIELMAHFKKVTGGTFDKMNYGALIAVTM